MTPDRNSGKESLAHRADVSNHESALGRITCHVTGRKNNGGRGYKHSYFKKHICAYNAILIQSTEETEKVAQILCEWGTNVLRRVCCKVVGSNAKFACKF